MIWTVNEINKICNATVPFLEIMLYRLTINTMSMPRYWSLNIIYNVELVEERFAP